MDEPPATANPTPGTATVTIVGGERTGTQSTATFTIGGSEGVVYIQCGYGSCPHYDTGTVSVTVNGFQASVSYGAGSTSSSVAWALDSALSGSPVSATVSGSSVTITSNAYGSTTNYSISYSSFTTNTQYFQQASFYFSNAPQAMTGGTGNGIDTGTLSLTVDGFTGSASFGQSSTPTTIASALAGQFGTLASPVSGSPVNATFSAGALALTSKATGPSTNYEFTSSATDTGGYSTTSFYWSPAGGNLTGGTAAGQDSNPAVTLYTYDTLDNLLQVQQEGNTTDTTQWRTRSFVYNSLSQLLTAMNPESGTINYTYDADGNLISKTMPAQNQLGSATVTLSYCYDALNRLLSKAYSAQSCPATTPVATYAYDQGTNGIGRRTAMTDAAGAESWSYDALGRTAADTRTTDGITKTTAYTYNLDGSLATLAYPSGRTITYTPSGAGRTLSAADTTNNINYATAAHYAPTGALCSLLNGPSIPSSLTYNTRLQPSRIAVYSSGAAPSACPTSISNTGNILDVSYNFSLGAGDNGNVMSVTNNIDNLRSQTFAYDALNRVVTAQTNATYSTSPTKCWGESYSYDHWANLLGTALPSSAYTNCTQENPGPGGAASANNQLSSRCYDAAGNLLLNAPCPQPPATLTPAYSYDAENHLLYAGGVNYTYDGDGNRVMKSNGPIYWYGTGGDVLDETDLHGNLTNEYVFFGGKRIARRDSSGNVFYYLDDQLGTARSIAEVPSGQTTATLCYDADFYPFGGERWYTDSCDSHYKFTGKERDTESGLDNFGARFDSSTMGRFMTPDWSSAPMGVPYANFGDPQSLNLYAYVRNNPLSHADADGHCDPDGRHCLWQKLKNDLLYNHFVTDANLNSALTNDAATMRQRIAAEHLKAGNQSLNTDFLNTLSNQQVMDIGLQLAFINAEEGPDAIPTEDAPEETESSSSGSSETSSGSTGRTTPANAAEQDAMEQARANPSAGREIPLKGGMKDPRWPASQGWVKMRQNINGVEIHYVRNTITGAVDDFKFK